MQEASPTLFGHPRGLVYLAFTEAWERFSYYGMTALLVLYMVGQLLTPGHAEHVLGLAGLRALLESNGPMSDQAFASLVYGWYGGLVYFTPILGGLLADRLLGTRATVVLGALLMAAGHVAMTFDASFLIALGLLILGSGCLKGNISAQVGQLYPVEAESLRTQAYTIFSAAINIGAVAGPIVCGAVAAIHGWHAGFGVAGALMILALVIYLAGQRHLPGGRERKARTDYPPLTAAERRRVLLLILLIVIAILPLMAYIMIWNIGVLWVDRHAELSTALGDVPASWFNSVDSFFSIIAVPPLVALWRWQAKRGREPGDIGKIGIGMALVGASALFMVAGSLIAGPDGRASVLWPLAGFAGMGIAFLYYWPVLLALVSRAAPAKVNATMMSASFLALFAGSVLMGWLGSYYDEMHPALFWTIDAAIGFAGALIILVVGRPLARGLAVDERKREQA
ncbi:MAG TPA: peptide MFS transporter [Allosphingosinicella sp.]|nr:peptide MFS transporter [Allosphingosinicella sp.]